MRANPIGIWGAKTPNGTWTGMIGALQRKEADVIIAGTAVSLERQEILDYPFVSGYTTPSI